MSGCVLDNAGNIVDSRLTSTPKTSASAVLSELKRVIAELLSSVETDKIVCIGVSTGGDVDHNTGEILSATDLIPDWRGVKLGDFLRNEFHRPVFVENDGSMAVYGEWRVGAAQGFHHVVGLTIGTGLGGGIISDGHLLHGARGAIANFGFLPAPQLIACDAEAGKRPLEYYLSGPGMIRIAELLHSSDTFSDVPAEGKTQGSPKLCETREILISADVGDPFALQVVKIFFEYLQYVLSIIQHVLSPEIVVLGGGVISGNYAVLRGRIEKLSSDYPFVIKISTLENKAGMIGAALYALEKIDSKHISG